MLNISFLLILYCQNKKIKICVLASDIIEFFVIINSLLTLYMDVYILLAHLSYSGLICLNWVLMQDCKRNAYMEAELQCSNAIQSMERKLRIACHASDANIDNVLKVSNSCLPLMSLTF